MPITVKVTPDVSAFRHACVDEVAEVIAPHLAHPAEAAAAAAALIDRFTVLPSPVFAAARTSPPPGSGPRPGSPPKKKKSQAVLWRETGRLVMAGSLPPTLVATS